MRASERSFEVMMIFGLMPHGYCFLWNIWLTSLHALSDGAIAIAYFSIPTVMYFNRERATEEIRPLVLMFAAFILSCGIGHIIAAWNIWHGNYWLEGIWKLVIATISLATAWQLRSRIPSIMGFHRQLSEIEVVANTDRLTGLANRRGLERAFNQLPHFSAVSSSEGHILMLIDLDHFKEVNDSYGHLVGDRLLQAVAQILNRHTRSADIVARLGGDEFAIILVGCSLPKGNAIAKAILSEIAQLRLDGIPTDRADRPLATASIGLHRLCLPIETSFEAIFQRADRLLYDSKHQGRDRITVCASDVAATVD